ncbi:hypothetical protein ZIOFF_028499 [Zingiber officinale]|uniref:Uncharacterized protein n=1 Tax=Zingiber officinale TaxID=94328 RepID=A0A8J5L3L9_ZINOF|nr:hypothetical protein ZIOFF_028499 [Zingiber officinale]
MGSALSKAANGVGAALGNAFVAPFKTIYGTSCDLLRLLMVSVLACITLLFIYLLFKVGMIQCLCRSLCKMTWVACASYCTALKEMASFLWHKLKNTKRVYRYQFSNMEESFSSSDYDSSEDRRTRRRRLTGERRKERIRKTLCPVGRSSKGRRRKESGHQVRLRTREVSVQLKSERRGRRSRAI